MGDRHTLQTDLLSSGIPLENLGLLYGNSQKPTRTIGSDDPSAGRCLCSDAVGPDPIGLHLSADR